MRKMKDRYLVSEFDLMIGRSSTLKALKHPEWKCRECFDHNHFLGSTNNQTTTTTNQTWIWSPPKILKRLSSRLEKKRVIDMH